VILDALRQSTAAVHQRVEKLLPLMEPSLTRPQYAEVLSRFYSVYAPLEARVQAACASTPLAVETQARRKARWIETDLASCGWSSSRINAITRADDLPNVADVASALGCMYVMEGATLGGQYICRAIEKSLHLTRTTGLAFFHSYGARTGAMWSAFRTLIADAPTTDGPAILAAAVATFDCFERAFQSVSLVVGEPA